MNYNLSVAKCSGEVLPAELQRRARIEGFIAVLIVSVVVQGAFGGATSLILNQFGGLAFDQLSIVIQSLISGAVFGVVIGGIYAWTVTGSPRRGWIAAGIVWLCAVLPWCVFDTLGGAPWGDADFLLGYGLMRLLSPVPLALMIAVDRIKRGTPSLLIGLLIGMFGVGPATGAELLIQFTEVGLTLEVLRLEEPWGQLSLAYHVHMSLLYVGGWAIARGREQLLVKRAIDTDTAVLDG